MHVKVRVVAQKIMVIGRRLGVLEVVQVEGLMLLLLLRSRIVDIVHVNNI